MASLFLCLWVAIPAFASADPDDFASTCVLAARRAAAESGVPEAVLLAISLAETGRRSGGDIRTWPWTVNMEGAGHWFDTRDDALDFAVDSHRTGARSFDVGCFQINYRWHGEHFASISDMFDPFANARYAAGFLARLRSETGSWSAAAGAYHSRTPELAARYRQRFEAFLRQVDSPRAPAVRNAVPSSKPVAMAPRANTYPLLVARTAPVALGSLVPLSGVVGGAFLSMTGPGS